VIGRYQSLFPAGTIMSLDSAVDAHHDQLRYRWKIVAPGGTPLQTGDSVVWKDREKSTSGRAALEARIAEWTAALSITGLAVDSFAQHDDVFRARFHATNDTATVGELFGHTGADGAIDWATVFDGELK
jgi:hypothetical protein